MAQVATKNYVKCLVLQMTALGYPNIRNNEMKFMNNNMSTFGILKCFPLNLNSPICLLN